MSENKDKIRVQHMLDATDEALAFCRGLTATHLSQDRKLNLAIVRLVEIIGEAAAGITSETRQRFPEVPWASIVAMRNRLIHAYFDIDLDRVWDTVTNDLPELRSALQAVLATL